MIRPVEALGGVSAAAKEVWLPGRIGADAGHAVDFALIGDGIDGVRGAGHQHHVDLIRLDQLRRYLSAAILAGLAVFHQDLDLPRGAARMDAPLDDLANRVKDKVVGFSKGRKGARLRADIANLDRFRGCKGPFPSKAPAAATPALVLTNFRLEIDFLCSIISSHVDEKRLKEANTFVKTNAHTGCVNKIEIGE